MQDCVLVRGETEMTSMRRYIFTKKMHQVLDTAVSETAGVSFCSRSNPPSASPHPKALCGWDCHRAYLNGFGFLLLFCACTPGHPQFFFYNLHSVYSVPLFHDDTQPSLSSSQSFLLWIPICLFRGWRRWWRILVVEAEAAIELDKIGWMLYKSLQRAVKSPSSLPCSPGNTCTKSIFNVKQKGFWRILINILFLQRYIHNYHKAARDVHSVKLLHVCLVLCMCLNLPDGPCFAEQTH